MDTARDKRQTIVNTWGKERGPMTPALKETLVQVSTATLTLQLLKRGIRRVALAGVAGITLHDTVTVTEMDLGAQFYLGEAGASCPLLPGTPACRVLRPPPPAR